MDAPLFPDFNMYSTPLLILVLQGLLFGVLLLIRYWKERYTADLLLGLVLIITCWHRTTYTIGFMGWYDTFRNTKVNYYLVSLTLLMAPLLYFYVRSVTTSAFKIVRRDYYHLVPMVIYLLYRIALVVYDSSQPGYADTQNGLLMNGTHSEVVLPIVIALENVWMVLYLAFTFQVYYQYKAKLTQYYSNTYQLELNWLRNFLFIYTFLFLYSLAQLAVNILISDLHWTQMWWYHFFSGLAIIYVGIKGYFTRTNTLADLEFNDVPSGYQPRSTTDLSAKLYSQDVSTITDYFNKHKPYLQPDLNLKSLAGELGYTTNQMSEIINTGFGQNFNDFVNTYRVNAVQQCIKEGQHEDLSLVGIAMDCGFNSKATFNRVFKKLTTVSPTEYARSIDK